LEALLQSVDMTNIVYNAEGDKDDA